MSGGHKTLYKNITSSADKTIRNGIYNEPVIQPSRIKSMVGIGNKKLEKHPLKQSGTHIEMGAKLEEGGKDATIIEM